MSAFSPGLHGIPNARELYGSFETDGADTDPINPAGCPFTVTVVAATVGLYLVTFTNMQFSEIVWADAGISPQATSETQRAIVTAWDAAAGTITIETQSAAGTEADLDGPRVQFHVVARQGGPERG
jgi:hypothetical protein